MQPQSQNFASIRSQRKQSPHIRKNFSQRAEPVSSFGIGHPAQATGNFEQTQPYADEVYNYQKHSNQTPQSKKYWRRSNNNEFQTPKGKYRRSPSPSRSHPNFNYKSATEYARPMNKRQDFIAQNEAQNAGENFARPARKYDKFLDNRGRGIRNMNRPASPRNQPNRESYKSGGVYQRGPPSVKSHTPQIYLNKYEDDCLYMNLEEEYLHRVSKRQGKSSNMSINRSMYNFK